MPTEEGGRGFARLYERAHHSRALAWGVLVVAVDVLASRAAVASVPGRGPEGYTPIPFVMHVPALLASLLVASLSGPFDALECAPSPGLAAARRAHLVGWSAAYSAACLAASINDRQWDLGLSVVRSLLVWLGVALVCGRVLGWARAWIGPIGLFLPVTFVGQDANGRIAWWFWMDQPAADMHGWLLAGTALLAGVAAYTATPWRLQRLPTRATGVRHRAGRLRS